MIQPLTVCCTLQLQPMHSTPLIFVCLRADLQITASNQSSCVVMATVCMEIALMDPVDALKMLLVFTVKLC